MALDIDTLDQRTAEELRRIIAKDVTELTEADGQFLKARSAYLDKTNRAKFVSILSQDPPKQDKAEKKDPAQPGKPKSEKKVDPNQHPAEGGGGGAGTEDEDEDSDEDEDLEEDEEEG